MLSPAVGRGGSEEHTPHKAACRHLFRPEEAGFHKIAKKYIDKDKRRCDHNKNAGQYLLEMIQQKFSGFIHICFLSTKKGGECLLPVKTYFGIFAIDSLNSS